MRDTGVLPEVSARLGKLTRTNFESILGATAASAGALIGGTFVGCPDTVPHVQRLAVYTGHALTELETALGVPR